MYTTFTNSKSKLNYWKLILREGQFHVIYLIYYSDVIVNIKWSLDLLADIILCVIEKLFNICIKLFIL